MIKEKIKLINFNTKLYVTAKSIEEFNSISSKIKNKTIIERIYWPVLKKEEGYWYSPFSKRSAIIRTLKEIQKNLPVMIDLELPTTQNSKLYLKHLETL